MRTTIFSTVTENQILDTLRMVERKAEFDMWVELYKTGIITEEKLIRQAKIYVPHFTGKD